jgi:hypothetical protein
MIEASGQSSTPIIGTRSPWMRIGLGSVLGILTVGVQTLVMHDAPIHFAPSLAAIALATLYMGYWAGLATLTTSAIAINYALLLPRWTWAASSTDLLATAVYVAIAALVAASVGPLHRRLFNLELDLERAKHAAGEETQLRRKAENEFHGRLEEMQAQCSKVFDLAQSAASIKRYADAVTRRLAVVNAAIAEIPVPVALLEDENGIPVIHAVSRSLIDLGNGAAIDNPALLEALGSIVKATGLPFEVEKHPLILAVHGTVVYGERIGWLFAGGQLREANLFAASVAQGRMLAFAIVPSPEPCVTPIVN